MNQSNKYGLNEVIKHMVEIVLEDISIGDYEEAGKFLKESLYEISFNAYQENLHIHHSTKKIVESCPIPDIKRELGWLVKKQLKAIEKNKTLLLGLNDKVDEIMIKLQIQLNNPEEK